MYWICQTGVMALFFFMQAPSARAQEAPLTQLSKEATSPQFAFKNGTLGSSGRETNMSGWLVLNGARFRNSEFPDLARVLRENYAQQGVQSTDPDFTPLPTEKTETDSHGRIVRGFAICPLKSICGDLVGQLASFNLDASL